MSTINLIINILLVVGGMGAFVIYYFQKKNKNREAAALIVTQIEEIKSKILTINDIAMDGVINETAFYETLDIINDNQWEKYRYLFIKKMDSYSYKTINTFYEYALSIREQLSFAKSLQRQQYINIQGMLDTNCNAFLLDGLNLIPSNTNIVNLRDNIDKITAGNEQDNNIKIIILGMLDELIKSNPNPDMIQFWKVYNAKKELLKEIVNTSPYISYIPKQVAVTLNKQLNNINSVEIIGCSGYKKLKKIAKLK